MLPIKKGTTPKQLADAVRRIKGTPDATLSWRNVSADEREATLQALLDEQGSLCAYCTRRVSVNTAHVEHIVPQGEAAGTDDPLSLDYTNLLAVCDGLEGSEEGLTCDRARGNAPLTVNPLNPETLENIRYRRDGEMLADDRAVDLDVTKTLNLNHPLLVRNRRAALQVLFARFEREGSRGGKRRVLSLCEDYIDEHLSNPKAREPYDGAIIYFMKRRLSAG